MSNLILRIDEALLDRARPGTTVAKIVREHLEKLTSEDNDAEARVALVRLCEESTSTLGDWKWNREAVYEKPHPPN
jgi:hypothetical protein